MAHHRNEHDRLALKLRQLREASGLSQRELARKIGRGQSYVAKVELGAQFVRVVELLDWCEATRGDALEALAEVMQS